MRKYWGGPLSFSRIVSTKVRDMLKRVQADGWLLVAQRGSHSQFAHPVKKGRVTIACHPSDSIVATGRTLEETTERMQAALEMHLAGMRQDGETIPESTSSSGSVTAAVQ